MWKKATLISVALVLSGAMWIWIQAIAIPHQQAEAAAKGTPRGNLSDLYPRWLGARELLLHGRDPYSNDVTREIQAGYYGRVLDPQRASDPKDQQAFAYPVYVVLLLAPTVDLPFSIVHGAFFWLLIGITAASVFLWADALDWQISRTSKIVWVLLTLSSFPAIQGAKLQQLSLLVAVLLACAIWAVTRKRLVVAGIMFAVCTIKPQLAGLPVVWLCIWIFGNWRKRERAFWAFAGAMVVLVGSGELLLPGWIHKFRDACSAYYEYTGGGRSVLDVALTAGIGRIVSVVLVGLFLVLIWRTRHAAEDERAFQWSYSFALATTLVVVPTFAPYNQLLLLPALMFVARSARELWDKGFVSRLLLAVTATVVFEQWIAAFLLAVALLFLPAATVQKAWALPFYPSLTIPVVVCAEILLAGRQGLKVADQAVVP
jgi:hypothetical protein